MTSKARADAIDAALLLALSQEPRATTIALAERIGVSRNTAQAHLTRFDEAGALASFERRISPAYLAHPLHPFVLPNLKQRLLPDGAATMEPVPEVAEVHGLSGVEDLLIQVLA